MIVAAIILLLLASLACTRAPVYYPPPEQRHPVAAENPVVASIMVNMNDEDAPQKFVRDIGALEGASWRWTQKRPTIKVLLTKTSHLRLFVDFTLPDQTFEQTGPVTLSFLVGDRLLDKVRYERPGYKHFDKVVPSQWLQTATETQVSAEVDRLYKSPGDGTTLGFILSRMGFEDR